MGEPFIGSEALAAGALTKSQLCTRYTRLFRDVYVDPDMPITAALRAKAGWLWGRRRGYPTVTAVAAIDALAQATDIKAADVELLAQRYGGRRGIARAREAVGLFDAGAQSPKESWSRVVLIRAGLPRPQTQIPVSNEFGQVIAYLDMGWEHVKVAVEYDGEQHRNDRAQYRWDLRR